MIQIENLNYLNMGNLMLSIINTLEKSVDEPLENEFKVDAETLKLIYISIIRTLQLVYLNDVDSEEEREYIKEKLSTESNTLAKMLNEIILEGKD